MYSFANTRIASVCVDAETAPCFRTSFKSNVISCVNTRIIAEMSECCLFMSKSTILAPPKMGTSTYSVYN